MDSLTDFFVWIDNIITFPQLSFLRPVFLIPVILLAIDLTFGFIFSVFSKFFGR